MTESVDCLAFDDAVAELALEILDPAERDLMLAHSAGCDRCRAELQILAATADRVVLLAPEAEPPLGFEQRAVHAVIGARSRVVPLLLTAAAAIVLFAAGLAVGRIGHHAQSEQQSPQQSAPEFRQAALVDQQGRTYGSVSLATDHGLILTMSLRALDEGTYRCVVQRRDGTAIEVASWPVGANGGGVWAVPVDAALDEIRSVSVTESDGTTVATAALD